MMDELPNVPTADTPIGATARDNCILRTWGTRRTFAFDPAPHWEILESRGLIDKTRARKVAAERFAYLVGDIVKLQFALINFALDLLTNRAWIREVVLEESLNVADTPFVPVIPPALINSETFAATARLEPQTMTFAVQGSDLWLNTSAEQGLCSMHSDEVLLAEELPLRYLGYATSFRKEADKLGRDLNGLIRMHQFDKLEMQSFSPPEAGLQEHFFLIACQERLLRLLDVPYRVILKCTADMGRANARSVDLEAWMPGQKRYGETHTADYTSDYQARRLRTFVQARSGSMVPAHLNDATALAIGRTLIAVVENYQRADGRFCVPECLRRYTGELVLI